MKCEVIKQFNVVTLAYTYHYTYLVYVLYLYAHSLYIHCICLVPPYHIAYHILEHVPQNHMAFTGPTQPFFLFSCPPWQSGIPITSEREWAEKVRQYWKHLLFRMHFGGIFRTTEL